MPDLTPSPAFAPLPHRALVVVRGEDRINFLQGLVSNDMLRVQASEAVWAAFLTPQGKFLHEFFAVPHNDTVLLECERARRDDLVTTAVRRPDDDRPPPAAPQSGARGAEHLGLKVGDDVVHEAFGEGVILDVVGKGEDAEAVVRFRGAGEKRLLLHWAPLRKAGS
jgi:hypothetical protein